MVSKRVIFGAWRLLQIMIGLSWACCQPGVVSGKDEFRESFLNSHHNQAVMSVVGEGRFIEPTTEGLKIDIKPPASDNTGVRYAPQLIGDFVVTVNATLLDVPSPSDGYGTGVTILLEDGHSWGASLQRVVMPGNSQILIAHHYTVSNGGYAHKAKTFPFEEKDVLLQIERHGSTLIYRAAAGSERVPKEFHRIELTAGPILVTQVYAQTGGAANDVSVRLKDLTIVADELLRPGQRSKVAAMEHLPILLGALVCIAAIATGLFLVRRRKSVTPT